METKHTHQKLNWKWNVVAFNQIIYNVNANVNVKCECSLKVVQWTWYFICFNFAVQSPSFQLPFIIYYFSAFSYKSREVLESDQKNWNSFFLKEYEGKLKIRDFLDKFVKEIWKMRKIVEKMR